MFYYTLQKIADSSILHCLLTLIRCKIDIFILRVTSKKFQNDIDIGTDIVLCN